MLTIKNYQTSNEIYKTRFVVQVYRDRLKTSLVHNASTTRHHSPRILTALASTLDLVIYSTDATQAYIQSKDTIDRDVYLIPPSELQLDKGHILKLLRPLYRLADSGDYWAHTNVVERPTERKQLPRGFRSDRNDGRPGLASRTHSTTVVVVGGVSSEHEQLYCSQYKLVRTGGLVRGGD